MRKSESELRFRIIYVCSCSYNGLFQTISEHYTSDNGVYSSCPFETVIVAKEEMKPRQSLRKLEDFEDSQNPELCQNLGEQCNSDEEEAFTKKEKKIKLSMPSELLAIESDKLKLFDERADDDLCFFESLLPYMRMMDMKTKLLCRMEIQKVVLSHFGEGNDAEKNKNNK